MMRNLFLKIYVKYYLGKTRLLQKIMKETDIDG